MKFIVETPNTKPTEMTEDEFRQWLDMFLADKTWGTEFTVTRRFR